MFDDDFSNQSNTHGLVLTDVFMIMTMLMLFMLPNMVERNQQAQVPPVQQTPPADSSQIQTIDLRSLPITLDNQPFNDQAALFRAVDPKRYQKVLVNSEQVDIETLLLIQTYHLPHVFISNKGA